jgi:pimeloyl-ACP methyl ester carboxylesterase
MMEAESGFIRNGNADLYYEIAGDGPPLVLLHAGVADCRQWNNEFTHFARDYRVMRYDRRGFGKSLPVDGEYTNMSDLIALLDALRLDQPLTMIAFDGRHAGA